MAFSEGAVIQSRIAGATFSSADLYKGVVLDSSGHVVLPNTTGNVLIHGTLYGRTSTTSGAGSQALPVAVSGVVKVQMAASTLAAGGMIGFSTVGLGIAPTTDAYTAGQIVSGSSGSAGRIHTVDLFRTGPLSAP